MPTITECCASLNTSNPYQKLRHPARAVRAEKAHITLRGRATKAPARAAIGESDGKWPASRRSRLGKLVFPGWCRAAGWKA